MITVEDTQSWAESQFASCQLGDVRRARRLTALAVAVGENPGASLPDQNKAWTDLKAAYRLFDRPEVTFDAVAQPHWEQTRQRSAGRYLIISDTTELDFTSHVSTEGLSPLGRGTTCGMLLHNALMVTADKNEIVGLAGQIIYHRKRAPKKENLSQRMKRPRESELWGDLVDKIGAPDDGVEYVHIFDRGGDNFEAFCHMCENNTQWVVRGSRLNRKVIDQYGESVPLGEAIKKMPTVGTYELSQRTRQKRKARVAKIEVRTGRVSFSRPRFSSEYVRQRSFKTIEMNIVWVRQTNPQKGEKPIEWVLLTSLPAASFNAAWKIIEYYEARWLIEEFHKSLKTGCSVEAHQLQHASRLKPLIGLLSVTAVRLLQLKTLGKENPTCAAKGTVPSELLRALAALRPKLDVKKLTVNRFIREVAKLGGFLGRASDGDPGWQTIWRGWSYLQTVAKGISLAENAKRCG